MHNMPKITQNKHKNAKDRFSSFLRHSVWKRRGSILILALHKFVTYLLTQVTQTLTHLLITRRPKWGIKFTDTMQTGLLNQTCEDFTSFEDITNTSDWNLEKVRPRPNTHPQQTEHQIILLLDQFCNIILSDDKNSTTVLKLHSSNMKY